MDPIHTGSDTIDGLLIKALHFHNQKDYRNAVRVYSDILAYQPEPHIAAIIHTHRGMARFALDDTTGAIEDFTETIRISPKTTKAYHYRAVVYRSEQQHEKALTDFSRCLEYDPYHIDSRIARAQLYRETGELEAAQADYRMAAKLEPENPAVVALRNVLNEVPQNDESALSQ